MTTIVTRTTAPHPLARIPGILCALLALLLPALHASAQNRAQTPGPYSDSTTIPDTPAYKRAQEILNLINAADADKTRAYINDAFTANFRDMVPMQQHLEVFGEVHANSSKLEPYSARAYEPARPATQATLIARNTLTESWQAIVVEVEDAEPHRIASLNFAQARPPSNLPKGEKLSDQQIADALSAYVQRLAKDDAFSGAVLFAKDGKVLCTAAVGIANRDFNAPNKLDTKFNLGSMNKMFTGVAAAQLVEKGKLSFDDPIGKYLGTDWLSQDALDQIQLKHLLTHTSGLGSYFTDDWDRASRAVYRNVDDYKPLVKNETLAFTPGTQTQYSNTGMLIAGAVIQKAAGQDYFDYIRANITGPAGMTNTDSYELDLVNPNLAVGYEKETTPAGTRYRNNIFMHVIKGGPAGGGYSTVEDLFKFDQALRSGKLLSKASRDQVWRAYPEMASPQYGYGFGVYESPAGKIVGHTGGFPGISAALSMYIDSGYTVAVLSNYGRAATLVDNKARELITQGK